MEQQTTTKQSNEKEESSRRLRSQQQHPVLYRIIHTIKTFRCNWSDDSQKKSLVRIGTARPPSLYGLTKPDTPAEPL
jgi:hypothetical protein